MPRNAPKLFSFLNFLWILYSIFKGCLKLKTTMDQKSIESVKCNLLHLFIHSWRVLVKNHSLREGKIIPQIMFSKILRRSNYIYHVNTIRISQTRKTVQTWLVFINLLRGFNTGTNLPRFVTNQHDIAFLCVFLSKYFRKIDTMPLFKLYFVLRIRCKVQTG